VNDLRRTLTDALSRISFREVDAQIWVRERTGNANRGRIAFNWWAVEANGDFAITPFVGVSHIAATEMLAELWPKPVDPYQPTAQIELAELVGASAGQFDIRSGTVTPVVDRLVSLYEAIGLPWMERMEDGDELRKHAQDSARREIVVPALLLAQGDADAALAFVDAQLTRLRRYDESAPGWRSLSDLYGEFSERVRKKAADAV
jgi:hypothetical protein